MSSMRNAVARRNHKERAQPLEREKWGILEKHKDYSLRAKDYNSKKARLKVLREKAENRNPDEFHYAMMSTKVDKNGFKIGDRGNKVLDHRVVKLLKTQDAGYIRTMRTGVKREIERLEMVVGTNNVLEKHRREEERNGHLRFMDEESLKKVQNRQVQDDDDDDFEDFDAEDEDELDKSNVDFSDPVQKAEYKAKLNERRRERKSKEVMRVKLRLLKEREQGLAEAEAELEAQLAKIHNVVGGVNKDGVKFKIRERKR